jgi:hypothetical protein
VQAGNQFSPAGDLNGDGVVSQADVPAMAAKLLGAGVPQAAVDQMIKLARENNATSPEGENHG